MGWPMSQDYNEAIQEPALCFSDPDLQSGEVVCNAMGLPVPCSGNFADVYAVTTPQRKYAVKCFTREIPGIRERYVEVSRFLAANPLPFMVEFKFIDQGIKIGADWYPILKMHWVEGFNLNAFVRDNVEKPQILNGLCAIWLKLAAKLRDSQMAHCDLQHGNVLLVPGQKGNLLSVRLVDYDGIFVPALEMLKTTELGHANFQHPQRQKEGIYSSDVDRFSHLVIYTALRALAVGGKALWQKFDNGDNLLFKAADFQAPAKAAVFQELMRLNDPEVKQLTQKLATACGKPLDQTPHLDELRLTPPPAAAEPAASKPPTAPAHAPAASTSTESAARPDRPLQRPKPGRSYVPYAVAGGVAAVVLIGAVVVLAMGSRSRPTEAVANAPPTATEPPPESAARPTTAAPTREPRAELEPVAKVEPKAEPAPKAEPEPLAKADPKPESPANIEPKAAKLPAPDAAKQAEAEKLIREIHKADFARKTTKEQVALADKLFQRAGESKDDPTASFVLLRMARDVAATAGDVPLAFKAIDSLAAQFAIDDLDQKATALETAARAPSTPESLKGLMNNALGLADGAVEQGNFDTAGRLLKVAESAALRTKQAAPLVTVRARVKDLETARKEYDKAKESLATLEKTPNDPAVNLAAGKYLAFVKGDWARGLPLLAKGNDEKLKALALKDQSAPAEAAEQAALGDGWYDLAEVEKSAKRQLWSRARFWYETAAPNVTPLLRARIEGRLNNIASVALRSPGSATERLQPGDFQMNGGPGVAVSPNGRRLAYNEGNKLILFDLGERKPLRTFEGHTAPITAICFSPDGNRVFSGSSDATIRGWDINAGKEVQKIEGHNPTPKLIACALDGRLLFSATYDEWLVRTWDLATGRELRRFSYHGSNKSVYARDFSPDGRWLVTSGIENTVRIWAMDTGKTVRNFDGKTNTYGAAFSPDGKQLLTCGGNSVRLWDLATLRELAHLTGHTAHVYTVAFSADSKRGASGSNDGTVRVWDLASGKTLHTLSGHKQPIDRVEFAWDGKAVISYAREGVVRVFVLPTD